MVCFFSSVYVRLAPPITEGTLPNFVVDNDVDFHLGQTEKITCVRAYATSSLYLYQGSGQISLFHAFLRPMGMGY